MPTNHPLRAAAATGLAVGALLVSMTGYAVAESAVQVSPDGRRAMITKDVGQERWVIVSDFGGDRTVTGNVFFGDGRPPVFVWCEPTDDDGNPDPSQQEFTYACFGADHCAATPCLEDDWTLIDHVTLPGSFFMAPIESCDVSTMTNGPDADAADSVWSCLDEDLHGFQFQMFEDGTGMGSTLGSFTFMPSACGFGTMTVHGGPDGGMHTLFVAGSRARGALVMRRSTPGSMGMTAQENGCEGSSRGGHLGTAHGGMMEALCTLQPF